jgi:hypothetical protein
MKSLIIAILVVVLSLPLFSDEKKQQKAPVPHDSLIVPFVPVFPDSLDKYSLGGWLDPELDPDFQLKMGIIIPPDPNTIELNPGGFIEVDPTVDVGIIIPEDARKKLLLEKNGAHLDKRKGYLMIPKKFRR